MVPFRYEQFVKDLVYLVEHGNISMSRIDDAVERILRVKFVSGLFEHPFSDRSLLDIVGCKVSLQSQHVLDSPHSRTHALHITIRRLLVEHILF